MERNRVFSTIIVDVIFEGVSYIDRYIDRFWLATRSAINRGHFDKALDYFIWNPGEMDLLSFGMSIFLMFFG